MKRGKERDRYKCMWKFYSNRDLINAMDIIGQACMYKSLASNEML